MPPSHPNDQSLLDRLNALKLSGVTLDKPANTAILPETDAQPISKEGALAARLRILRSRGEGVPDTEGRPGQPGRPGGVGDAPPPVEPPPSGGPSPKEKVVSQASSASPAGPRNITQERPSYLFVDSQADDEDALDELLEALGEEDFNLAADEDAEPPSGFDASDEAKRVAGLLESLQEGSGHLSSKGSEGPAEDDDDSDGERMTSAVETLLSQIRDEISSPPPPAATPAKNDNHATEPQPRSAGVGNDAGPGTASNAAEGNGDGDELPFTLPAVPSQLVDPVPGPNSGDDFEKDISARMASLRGFGSLDALGLPSAPTFRPQDHNPSSTFGKGLLRSSKYTDEDQKTWCVVCLEDATIECIGCERDVYCGRCWKEMHVGPSAGYDERGHQWVKFERAAHP
ncbi:hypothetical protein C8A01DRAFT_16687 [Parachaetomium inaequale]|uniref:Abscission/NoCut checkpoint regulator n=1 Tax=Parachaetomium inaequale TaxID=2588326 RepID=A0AAN6PFV1_9PEZI|nr:hypothetical protein C8A01DRAFT_16687 [Parachaetomium inaequale]